jgi:hypothetical protein
MSHDMYELLREAKAGAPPARYTVDEIVAGGRRRRRRHRVAWTGGAAAGVAVLVAAALAAPQVLVGRHGAGPAPAPAAASVRPAATPAAAAAALAYPAAPFAYAFHGYTAGEFEVSDPVLVTPGYQEAFVRRHGETEDLYGSAGEVVATAPAASTMLTVYRPGVFRPTRFLHAEPVRVHDRPGYFGADITYRDERGPHPRPALAWQYADNAWAVLSNLTPTVYTKADLIKIAEGLPGSPAYPATVAFRASWTPPGYRVTSAGTTDDYPNGGPYLVSSIRLVTTRPAYQNLTQTIDASQTGTPTIRVALYPVAWTDSTHRHPGSPATCNPGNHSLCYRMTADGKYLAEVVGSGGQSQADLKRILDGLTFAQVGDGSTWFPLAEAVPGGAV